MSDSPRGIHLGHFKIGTRLGLGFGVMVATLFGVSLYTIANMNYLAELTEKLYRHPYTVSTSVLKARVGILTMHRGIKDVVLARNTGELDAAVTLIQEQEAEVYRQFDMIEERFLGDQADVAAAKELFEDWEPIRNQVIAFKRAGNDAGAAQITRREGQGGQQTQLIFAEMDKIADFADNRAMLFMEEAQNSRNLALQMTWGVVSLAVLGTIGVAIAITRSIVVPLQQTVQLHNQLSQGALNLHIESQSDDEVGQLLRSLSQMVTTFQKIVRQVQTTSDAITAGSQGMSRSAVQMSSGTTEQASAAQQASVAITKMTNEMRQTADRANSTQAIAQQVALDAAATGKAMQMAVAAMTAISQRITLIEDIATQTNMLALNASIEAVRSQDNTNGFGVVAIEIRKLAEHTRKAALEINQLSHSSLKSVQTAGQMLDQLVPSIQKTSDLIEFIAASNQEQLQGSSQIKQAIQQLEQVMQQNNQMAAHLSQMSTNLAEQSHSLQSGVAFFQA